MSRQCFAFSELRIEIALEGRRRVSALDNKKIVVLPLQSRRGKVRGAGAQPSPVDLVALEVHRGAGLVLDPYLVVTYIIEPVQDLKKAIGMISYALIERGSVISNPGNSTKDVIG